MNNNLFENKVIIITGGTDGMGAAAAIEFCKMNAIVHIIGRSEDKAKALQVKSARYPGQLSYTISDFSLLKNVERTAEIIADKFEQIHYIIHAVGILITKTQHTQEGLEKDFAVSYLSRFLFNEVLFSRHKFTSIIKFLNVAASGPRVPSFAQMEFDDIKEVKSRTGMKSHGQAQLANDLYTALAAARYNVVSIGYGPGSVDTNIRREIPKIYQLILKPFFAFSLRKPADVAKQWIDILSETEHLVGKSYYYNKNGRFPIASFINNPKRQADLLRTSLSIILSITKEGQ